MSGAAGAVRLRGVGVTYGDTHVLENVSLDVAPGAFCTIVGASGCGKSTLLRLLLSQERATAGTIEIAGRPIAPEPTPDRGIVFQRYSVFPHLTVEDNVILTAEFGRSRLAGRLFGAARRRARNEVGPLLERIGLGNARRRYPSQLSGGMQQRLAVAQALVREPAVLLLDEPFGALDPGIRGDMQDLLLELWRERGMTVFMVTHDLAEAFRLGTRLLVFDKRRHDPHAPERYGATITYDLPIADRSAPDPDQGLF